MPVVSNAPGPEQISWSIGGKPVTMEWQSCSMTAPGGYSNLTGTVTGNLQKRKLKQGARVVGTRPNGKTLYQGTLVSQPKIVNGVATIEAEGYQAIIRRRNQRLPYVVADVSQWSQSNDSPFNYENHERYTLQSKADGLGWLIETTVSYNSGDRAGYALYVPGHAIQRIRSTVRKSGSNSNFDLDLYDADDIGGLGGSVNSLTLGAGTADGAEWNAPAINQNTAVIFVRANAGVSPGSRIRVTLQDVRACVIADDDDWVTSQVVSDVAARVGFGDDVDTTSTLIGSLDWTGGWDELLDYMAAIEDKTWLVVEDTTKGGRAKDAQLTFRDWGFHTWKTTLDMATENLTVAPLYNRVTVHYERPEGVPQHKSFTPDDFSDMNDPIVDLLYEYPDPPVLENPQRNTTKVDLIGERLLRRVNALRLIGNVKVTGLTKGRPFDIKAGDKLDLQGFQPDVPPQRVTQVTYNSDGTVDCSLERSFDIAAMLFRLSAHRRRSTPHKWGSGHRS